MREVVRVLVVDDNEDHAFLTAAALRSVEGVRVEVESVRDGAEALDYLYRRGEFAERPRPHLVMLDLKMPKVDGLAVLERLKEDRELREIPVVVVTSSSQREDVNATYRLGGNSYVTKSATVPGFRDGVHAAANYWLLPASLPDPPP